MLTLLLIGGAVAAWLVFKPTSASQQATQQGAQAVVTAGVVGDQPSNNLRAVNQNINEAGVKGVGGATVGGVTTGLAIVPAVGPLAASVVGVVILAVAVAVELWAKHEARIKGAKNENAAMNIAVPGWLESIQGIIQQYNSNQIDSSTAAESLNQLRGLVFQSLQKYNHVPGVDWKGGVSQPGLTGKKYWGVACNKHCTIGCCLFNNVIGPATNNAIALVLHQQLWVASKNGLIPWQKSFTIPAMPPMATYGFVGSPATILTVNK
jgi:hypothetical protein